MANRVNGTDVKAIINTSLSSSDVEPFITSANMIVTAKCADLYSAAELVELEKWLSAHFVSIRDPSRSAVVSQTAGKTSQQYGLVGAGAQGLQATPYGQQVMILDYNSALSSLGTRNKAVFRVFGASNSDFDSETA